MESSLVTLSTYTDFSRRLLERVRSQKIPASGSIEVTRRCPLSCLHCYNNLPIADDFARCAELSAHEHRRILDEIADAGCLHLLYTGGEIFARPDFLEIYDYAKSKGLLITLFTNATLITEAIADRLAKLRPFAIEVSIYGHTREIYERVTRVPGSYDRFRKGIGLLCDRGLPLKLKTIAMTANKHGLWDMKRFAEGLGLRFAFDSQINPRIDCSQSPLAVRLTPEEVVELDLRDCGRVAEWKRLIDLHSATRSAEERNQLYCCGGGLTSWTIQPDGKLSLCMLSPERYFDLRSGSFLEGWEQVVKQLRQQKITRRTKCTDCHIRGICGMCPANGELEKGDAESPVDFLCHVAHLRALSMGASIPEHGECEFCPGGSRHRELMQSLERLGLLTPVPVPAL